MPDENPFEGVVQGLWPNETALYVEFPGLYPLSLAYDHPAYSSIFALLMASAVNKREVWVYTSTGASGETGALKIQGVRFEF